MGGVAKGLLDAPCGRPIVARTRALVEAEGARCVLVGEHPAYAELGIPIVSDDPCASGPLAGLLALLEFTAKTEGNSGMALAIACDMPQLTPAFVHRLLTAPAAPVVAPRRWHVARGWLWEPLAARYDPNVVLASARAFALRGERRLQSLLDEVGVVPLTLEPGDDHALVDWDSPTDIVR